MKTESRIYKIVVCCLFMILHGSCAFSNKNVPIDYNANIGIALKNMKTNQLSGSKEALYPVFKQLAALQRGDTLPIVSIVHIGDSHIQPDFLTGTVRNLLQQYFGNAGRGLISPQKMTKSNEPSNYKIVSQNSWSYARCVKPNTVPIGLTGLGLFCTDTQAVVLIETFNQASRFNQLIAYYNNAGCAMSPANTSLLYKNDSLSFFSEKLSFNSPINSVELHFCPMQDDGVSLFGFDLRNGQQGVLYHAIGINGAQYQNYGNINLFCQQVGNLEASLFIISLGTNEAYGKNFDSAIFYAQISKTIDEIKRYSPNAQFLLTTPIETFVRSKKQRVPQSKIQLVRNTIVDYATKNNLAYWDLYTILGGKNSAYELQKNNLLAKDGIHSTKASYEMQGRMLFEAIIKSYNNFLSSSSNAQY